MTRYHIRWHSIIV